MDSAEPACSTSTPDGTLKKDLIDKELFQVELLANDDEKFILKIGKKNNKIVFLADEKYNLTPIYYSATLDYDDFLHLGKSFKLCDDLDSVEKTLSFFLEKYNDKEKGYNLSIIKKSKKCFLLTFNVLLTANQNDDFSVELRGIEQDPWEINCYLKEVLKMYLKEYGTEVIDKREELNSLFISIKHDIITDFKDIELINEGLKHQTNKKIKKMKLIYKATEDDDSSDSFHDHCDGISNTLVLVKTTNGKRFGGFTTQKWEKNDNYVIDNSAFLFSLDTKNCYYIYDINHAIYGNKSRGPCFGGGHDLCIQSGCLSNNISYESTGHSYETKGLKMVLSGSTQFQVDDYEVYQLELI